MTATVLLAVLALAIAAPAQTLRFNASQLRVTVPLNTTNSMLITNWVTIADLDGNPVTFDVSGLPPGAGAVLTDTNLVPVTSLTASTNLWLTLNTTNIAEGVYTFSLNGSGANAAGTPATNRLLFTLQAAHIWNGSIVTTSLWSAASSWLGGVPGTAGDVVFADYGAQTNLFTNCVVDVDTTVGSLRFAQTGFTNAIAFDDQARPVYHTIQISSGKTLSITGTNGFSFLRDYVSDSSADTPYPASYRMVNTIAGNKSTMVVSNRAANFTLAIEAQRDDLLDMSGLTKFVANVNRVGLGDFSLYPNWWNLDANNYGGIPRRFTPSIYLAATNIITAWYVDPNNYTNADDRLYGLTLNNSAYGGTTHYPTWSIWLGASNTFLMDSICLVGANQQGRVQFNPAFATNKTSYAYFRNTNGLRMTMFAVSDDAGTNYSSSNIKSWIDFGSYGGSVDILVDRFYMARDRRLLTGDGNFQADLAFGKGTIDANKAILGYQEYTARNTNTSTYRGYCQATLTVTNTAVFKVNDTLELGYATETDPLSEPFNNRGLINIGPGGTVMAKTILFGGPAKVSSSSAIRMSGGAQLIVSNTVAGVDGMLPSLSMSDSVLTLFLNGTNTDPYVYVTNLTCGGLTNLINLAAISGVTSYPTQYALIKYETASANFSARIPAGQYGFVLNNTANSTIDVYLFTNAPRTLVWRGDVNGNWDTTTLNWVQQGTSTATAFSPGDIAVFDDSAASSSINVVGVVFPGETTVSNVTKNLTFTGSGSRIAGTAKIYKFGAAKLTVDLVCENSLTLNEGAAEITANGQIGTVTAATGTQFACAGTAFGLTSLGTATNSGSIYGATLVRGGTFGNSGYINTRPGVLGVTNGFMLNTASGIIDVMTGNWAVDAGGTLANFGLINNMAGRLNINAGGVVYGPGTFMDPNSLAANPDGRVAINAGAVLSPGSSVSNSIGTTIVGGRLDLNSANGYVGTLLVDVDFSNPQTNDMVGVDGWANAFGQILMNNINPNAGTFASGQSFLVFSNNNGSYIPNTAGDQPAQMPVIWPVVPGPGLTWYLYNLRTNGIIAITNSLTWRGNVSAVWDTTTPNWKDGALYSDERGVLFDDTATGATDISLAALVNSPGTDPNYSTNMAVFPAVTVNNSLKQYTFKADTGGKISGKSGLYKTGPGTLTIEITTNDYTGPTFIDGGTLVVTMLTNWDQPSSIGQPKRASLSSANVPPVLIDGATLKYIGPSSICDRFFQLNPGGGVIDVASASVLLTLKGQINGPGILTKNGPGIVALTGTANIYAGGTLINAGLVQLQGSGTASTNTITLAGGAMQPTGAGFTLKNPISISGAGNQITSTNVYVSDGAWSGSGSVTFNNSGQFIFNKSLAAFGGTLSLGASTGTFRFNNTTNGNTCTGSALATFDLGTGSATLNNLNGGGVTYDLGALTGGAGTILAGRSSNTTTWAAGTIYSIGANGSNTVFSGTIANGQDTVAVTKVGSGTLLLNGANTYTGNTTVSAGTLGGSGTISGPVTVAAGGNLAPGASIGTLTVNNSLTLAGNTTVEVSRNAGVLASDKVVGLTSVTFGGTLTVASVGPDAVQAGDSFQLFNRGGTGNFTSITPALPGSLAWKFDPTTGILSVIDNRPQLTCTQAEGALSLSWLGSGFKLQVQTNRLDVGLSVNWSDYPGGGTSPVTVPLDPAQGTVFFRLISIP